MNLESFYRVSYSSENELCKNNNLLKKHIISDKTMEFNRYEAIISQNERCFCGIKYYDHGLKPQIITITGKDIFYIAFNRIIAGCNYLTKKTIFIKELPSLFFELIQVTSDIYVIICEMDACAIDSKGEIFWTVGFKDIVSDYCVQGNVLNIKCDDGDESSIDILSGSLL